MNKKSPEIRFKGFTDDWEQHEFLDSFEFPVSTNSLSRAQLNYDKGIIRSVHYGDILINYNSVLDVQKNIIPFVTDGTFDKYKHNLLKNGDIIFADAAEDESVGKVVEVYNIGNENIVAGLHTIVARSRILKGHYFLGYYINSNSYRKQILRLMQGTKVSSISKKTLTETKVIIPITIKEQGKIGQLFKTLDDTIALHQDAIQRQQDLKKALLQKLFPVNGERIPTVRFANFKEKWEQRKLNSIVERITRKNKNLESNLPLTISAQYGLVDQNTFFKKQVASKDVSGYFLVKKGEFAYNKSYSSGYPWGAIKRLDNYDKGVLSTLYIVFKPKKIESDFLMSYYDTNFWHKEVSVRAAEGARNHGLLNISAQDFFETELIIPIKPEEQSKIGAFFKQLDETITLHQQALDKLNLLKQSLLQKMFV